MYTSIGGVTKKLVDFLVESNGIKQIKELYAVKEDGTIAKVWEKVSGLICNAFIKYSGSQADTYGFSDANDGKGLGIFNASTKAGYPNLIGSFVIEGEFDNPEIEIAFEAHGSGTSYVGVQLAPYTDQYGLYYAQPSHGEYEYTKTLTGSGDKLYINFLIPYNRTNPYDQSVDIYSLKIDGKEVKFDIHGEWVNGTKVA